MTSDNSNKYTLAIIGVIILLSVVAGFIVGYQIALIEHSTDYNEGWVLGYDKGYSDVVDLFNPTNYHSWNWSYPEYQIINSTQSVFESPPTEFEYPVAIVNVTFGNDALYSYPEPYRNLSVQNVNYTLYYLLDDGSVV